MKKVLVLILLLGSLVFLAMKMERSNNTTLLRSAWSWNYGGSLFRFCIKMDLQCLPNIILPKKD